MFKQAVTSEDMYLQMRGKNPSSSSCEDLVVRAKIVLLEVNKSIKINKFNNRNNTYFGQYEPQQPIFSVFLLELTTSI